MFGNLAFYPNPAPAAGGSPFGLSISFSSVIIFLSCTVLGAFGVASNNPSMFGATEPATGFGAFGGGGTAFGATGGTFGSAGPSQPAASNKSLFGQPSTTSGAFGAGTFGGKPATSAFGATTCLFWKYSCTHQLTNLS